MLEALPPAARKPAITLVSACSNWAAMSPAWTTDPALLELIWPPRKIHPSETAACEKPIGGERDSGFTSFTSAIGTPSWRLNPVLHAFTQMGLLGGYRE